MISKALPSSRLQLEEGSSSGQTEQAAYEECGHEIRPKIPEEGCTTV